MAILIDARIFLNEVRAVPAQANMKILYKYTFYVIIFFGSKSSPGNLKYMTRNIFLGGNPNRRPDSFEDVREHPAQVNREISCEIIFYVMKYVWPEILTYDEKRLHI